MNDTKNERRQLLRAGRHHVRWLKRRGVAGFLHPHTQRVAYPQALKNEMALAVKYFWLAKQARKSWLKYAQDCGQRTLANGTRLTVKVTTVTIQDLV
jgi:hypothetical protein